MQWKKGDRFLRPGGTKVWTIVGETTSVPAFARKEGAPFTWDMWKLVDSDGHSGALMKREMRTSRPLS